MATELDTIIARLLQLPRLAATPGSTAIQLMEATIPGRDWQRLTYFDAQGNPQHDLASYSPFALHKATDLTYHGECLSSDVTYDVNNMYLASCSSVSLGINPYRWVPERLYSEQPGLWRIASISGATHPLVKLLYAPLRLTEGWQYSPTIQFLEAMGVTVKLQGGYAFDLRKRYLQKFYLRMSAALARVRTWEEGREQEKARRYLKDMYCQGIAYLATRPTTQYQTYRPDFRELVRDQAKASLLYKLAAVYRTTGALPTSIRIDAVTYRQEVPLKLGVTPGTWKLLPPSTVSDSQWLARAYLQEREL